MDNWENFQRRMRVADAWRRIAGGCPTGGRRGPRNPGQLKGGLEIRSTGRGPRRYAGLVPNAARGQSITLPVQATETLPRGDCNQREGQRQWSACRGCALRPAWEHCNHRLESTGKHKATKADNGYTSKLQAARRPQRPRGAEVAECAAQLMDVESEALASWHPMIPRLSCPIGMGFNKRSDRARDHRGRRRSTHFPSCAGPPSNPPQI